MLISIIFTLKMSSNSPAHNTYTSNSQSSHFPSQDSNSPLKILNIPTEDLKPDFFNDVNVPETFSRFFGNQDVKEKQDSEKQNEQNEHNIESLERRFHTPTYTRKSTRHISQLEPDTTALWGWFLLFAAYFIFVFSMYAIVISKFVPETGNKTLDWIKKDEYYCLLIPLTLPVTIYAIFFNWLGMKFFRHN